MFALGIGEKINQDELNGIGGEPKETFVFNVKNFNDLEKIQVELSKATCEILAGQCTVSPLLGLLQVQLQHLHK